MAGAQLQAQLRGKGSKELDGAFSVSLVNNIVWKRKILQVSWKLKQKNVNALKRKNAIVPINKSIKNFQDNWGKWLVFHNILEFYMVFTKCNSSITASIKLRQKSCRKKYSLLFTSPFLYSRINRASCNLPHRLRVKFFKY